MMNRMIYSMLNIVDTDSSDGCSGTRTGMHIVLLRRSKYIDRRELVLESVDNVEYQHYRFTRFGSLEI